VRTNSADVPTAVVIRTGTIVNFSFSLPLVISRIVGGWFLHMLPQQANDIVFEKYIKDAHMAGE
jgi:hypothetical protein